MISNMSSNSNFPFSNNMNNFSFQSPKKEKNQYDCPNHTQSTLLFSYNDPKTNSTNDNIPPNVNIYTNCNTQNSTDYFIYNNSYSNSNNSDTLNSQYSTPNKLKTNKSNESDYTPKRKKTKRRQCTISPNSEKEMNNSNMINMLNDDFKIAEKINFMEKIEQCGNYSSNDFESKLKGCLLLKKIDNNNNNDKELYLKNINIMKLIFDDNDLYNTLINEIIFDFVNGFNEKKNIFCNFLSDKCSLEIINFPLVDFNHNLKLLNDNILSFSADFNTIQIEPFINKNYFYLTVCGTATLNTINKDVIKFILSFKVNFNSNITQIYLGDFFLKNVICIDYIKIKLN